MATAALQVITVLLVAVAFALALAHVSELPGKKRLPRDIYFAVQQIYYPGFTIGGGIGEYGGALAALILVALTPRQSPAFWLTLVALLGLGAMQAIFWAFVQPVNKYWVQGMRMGRFGATFFSTTKPPANADPQPGSDAVPSPVSHTPQRLTADWVRLRDQWEYSHVARAVLATISFTALVIACKVL
jgi:hypothetical protein